MEGLERCHDCYKLPEITIEDKGPGKEMYWITCKQPNHVHQACGDSPQGAVANWNIYVMMMRKAA